MWDLGPGNEMVGKETKGMMDLEKGVRRGRCLGFMQADPGSEFYNGDSSGEEAHGKLMGAC